MYFQRTPFLCSQFVNNLSFFLSCSGWHHFYPLPLSITIHLQSHLAAYIKLALKPSFPESRLALFASSLIKKNLQAVRRLEQESQTPIWQACPFHRSTFKIFPRHIHADWIFWCAASPACRWYSTNATTHINYRWAHHWQTGTCCIGPDNLSFYNYFYMK